MQKTATLQYRPAEELEYPAFMKAIYEHAGDYLEPSLLLLGIDQAEFEFLFRSRGEVHAMVRDSAVVGFRWVEFKDDTLHLHALIVHPEFRKQGLAHVALDDVNQLAKGRASKIELGVHRSNHRAKAIYEKAGFTVTRELDEFDFCIMHKLVTT